MNDSGKTLLIFDDIVHVNLFGKFSNVYLINALESCFKVIKVNKNIKAVIFNLEDYDFKSLTSQDVMTLIEHLKESGITKVDIPVAIIQSLKMELEIFKLLINKSKNFGGELTHYDSVELALNDFGSRLNSNSRQSLQ